MGKDSSAMLTLLWDAIAELPLEQRTNPIHILTSEVGVETPAMTAYISRTLQKIQENANEQNLPFVVHGVKPLMKESYWYKVIGRGVLPPSGNSRLRWCTDSQGQTDAAKDERNLNSFSNYYCSRML